MNETDSNNNYGFKAIFFFCLFSIVISNIDSNPLVYPIFLVSMFGIILVPLGYIVMFLVDKGYIKKISK